MVVHVNAMLALQRAGAVTFDYGNNIRRFAFDAGCADAFLIPGFVPEYIRPLFCTGQGPFRWVALSGDPKDIDRTDELALELFPENEILVRWLSWRVAVSLFRACHRASAGLATASARAWARP